MAKNINEAAMHKVGVKGMQGRNGAGSWQGAWTFAMGAKFGWRQAQDLDDGEGELDWEIDKK